MKKEKRRFEFIEGQATKELAKYIPIENLRFYYSLYKVIKTCSVKTLVKYNIKKKAKDINKVFRCYNEGKATKRYAIEKIKDICMYGIVEGMAKSRLKTFHRPTDDALYILLYALRFDLIHYSGKPKHKLISDFLLEQGIDKKITYDDVNRKLRKILKKPICHILAGYQDSFNVIMEAFEIGSLQGIYYGGFYSHFIEYDERHKAAFSAYLIRGNNPLKN